MYIISKNDRFSYTPMVKISKCVIITCVYKNTKYIIGRLAIWKQVQ